jgi:outer membrane protein assembly factor BamB
MFEKEITATLYPSGFKKGDSNFNSLSVLSDGLVYYTISSHDLNTHGRVYRFDPETGNVSLFADLGDVTGETGKKSLPQGKSHAPFMETEDKIYITTHYGYYQGNDGKEEPAPPPEGYTPYPGGKIIEYDKKSKRFTVLATAPSEEGIILSGMDAQRGITIDYVNKKFTVTGEAGDVITLTYVANNGLRDSIVITLTESAV